MKNLLILLVLSIITLTSCQNDDNTTDCECTRTLYEITVKIEPAGTVQQHKPPVITEVILGEEEVGCEDEVEKEHIEDNLYFSINCK